MRIGAFGSRRFTERPRSITAARDYQPMMFEAAIVGQNHADFLAESCALNCSTVVNALAASVDPGSDVRGAKIKNGQLNGYRPFRRPRPKNRAALGLGDGRGPDREWRNSRRSAPA